MPRVLITLYNASGDVVDLQTAMLVTRYGSQPPYTPTLLPGNTTAPFALPVLRSANDIAYARALLLAEVATP